MDRHTNTSETQDSLLSPLIRRIGNILNEARAAKDTVALLLVHSTAIDRVDARLGYNAGDRFSEKITTILQSRVIRKKDAIETLARDEFACILRSISSEGIAMLAAQRIMALLGSSPIEFGQFYEFADVAIGIAMFPEHGMDAEMLLQNAKHALHTARGLPERICIYESHVARNVIDQSQYATRLCIALDQNKLNLHYMPKVQLRTGLVSGAEALLRWEDAVLGPVPAYTTVQVAESSGLIDRLTQWVITRTAQQCAELQAICPDFSVSVNVSPSNLREPDLPRFIDRALRTWNVSSHSLIIEITESAMMADPNSAIAILNELKSLGVLLSIDDFGTGYSSMYYLANMPLDELKIDQSFVFSMLDSPTNAKIVRSLIELAHNLDLHVVAEGVENQKVLDSLAHLGCDYAQGYHISMAISVEQLVERLRHESTLTRSSKTIAHD